MSRLSSDLKAREQHVSLLPVFLIVLVDVFGMTLVIPLLAIYAETFGATPLQATMLVTVFAACQLVSGPLLGHASDRTGRKPMLLISQVGTCIGFLVLASATSLWVVYLSRIIDGVTAGNLTLAQAYIADNTPPERRAKSFGLIGIAFGLGFFIGPSITGLLSARYGLNAPIYLAAVMSATSILCTATLLKPGGQPMRSGEHSRWEALSLKTYARYFHRPELRTRLLQFLFFMLSFSLFISGFALFAERRFTFQGHPFGPREIGFVFGFVGFLGIILQGGFIGRLVARFGESALVAVGFATLVIGYFGLGLASSVAMLVVVSVVASFGNGVLRPALTSLITHQADRHEQGVVLGITQSMTSMASIVAPIVAGLLIQYRLLTAWAWIAAGLAAVGAVLARGGLKPRAAVAAIVVFELACPDDARAQPSTTPPTLHAVRLAAPLQIDGRLDEALYRDVEPITGFVQIEPEEGAPATEKTEIWIAFDADNVYVTFRCWETHPERIVAKEMRRDNSNIWGGDDNVSFMLDTFHDKRSTVEFTMNSIGGRQDGQSFNERQWSGDWNAVWDLRAARFEGGWVVETAIPFKSLRYRPGQEQIWGFNAFRTNRWKNELSFLTPISKARGQSGLHMASLAADLVGIVAPSGAKNLEIKPYAISNTTGVVAGGGRVTNDLTANAGIDAKYGITQSLTADLTYNTDFAQVEADQQQINLTRFSLFFPEKRDFFLENSGTFTFGQNANFNNGGDTPILFYSRRIGLEDGQLVPIRGGGRVTGRAGRYTLGLLNIQAGKPDTGVATPTNFSVVRVRRDVLRGSSVGLLLTGRNGQGTSGDNVAYGVDGIFSFFSNLGINTYWARTQTKGRSSNDTSYRAQLDYTGDRYGLQLERMNIGENFNPGVGYVRRADMRRSFAQARFSPRPKGSTVVRKYSWTGSMGYIENASGRLETREHDAEFGIEFQNADRFTVGYGDTYEFLPVPFRIARGVTLPVGGYTFGSAKVGYNRAQRRRVSANLSAEHGTFYNGRRTAFGIAGGRVGLSPQFSIEPTYSLNRVSLAQGDFTTHLAGSRLTFTATPFMFVSALLQYNSGSHSMSSNVRLRWEYRPGSELFVVYNDERDTFARRFPALTNRAFVVKVNRLLRF